MLMEVLRVLDINFYKAIEKYLSMKDDHPPEEKWGFPSWLYCVCDSENLFGEARDILINDFGFVPSPIEEGVSDQALVIPRPDIDLSILSYWEVGWGIGRTRLSSRQSGESFFDFNYFQECPWEFIKDNPSREPMRKLYSLLKPVKCIDAIRRKEIDFPY